MDVRCEKCQTEYELDESRLKPGGVTVKCTNCGHMFKIRKRSPTNVGANAATAQERPRPSSNRQPPPGGDPESRARTVQGDSLSRAGTAPVDERRQRPSSDGAIARAASELGSGPNAERQWLIRLDNGEQKACRELATLQQWIVAGVVTRESLISRSGKTWKRLGDIAELAQYFDIADEARTTRDGRKASPTNKVGPVKATMLGVGAAPTAAGGTILPDDDED